MKIAKRTRRHPNLKPVPRSLRSAPKVSNRASELERVKKRRIADSVRHYIEEQGITRLQLEKMLGRGESTMNHFFAGDFSPALLTRIERKLGQQFGESSHVAPIEWGQYTRESTTKLVGNYLTLRNDFEECSKIRAYVTTIEWANIEHAYTFDGQVIQKPRIDGHGLIFREERRTDDKHTHRGQVWMPGGQFLYLVTAYGDGRLRAAIASLPDDNKMCGIQLSLYNVKGPAFIPAASPVVFVRREKIANDELGIIEVGHPRYEEYRKLLTEASNSCVFAIDSLA